MEIMHWSMKMYRSQTQNNSEIILQIQPHTITGIMWDYIIDEAAKRYLHGAGAGLGQQYERRKYSKREAYGYFGKPLQKQTNIIWMNGGDVKGTEGGLLDKMEYDWQYVCNMTEII